MLFDISNNHIATIFRAAASKHASEQWRIIYKQPAALAALLLVGLHQCIVASSTIFLTSTIDKFQSNQEYHHLLYAYLIAMAIPYVPGCASFVYLQKWINESHRALVSSFVADMRRNPQRHSDKALCDRVIAILSRNSFSVIRDYASFIHDLASFTLNSILSMAVIGFLLPPRLVWGYFLSLALCFMVVASLRKVIAVASSTCEYSYVKYSDVLNKGWANITIGNRHNEDIWKDQRQITGRSFYSSSSRLEIYKQIGNILLAGASLVPTIYLIVSIVRDGATDAYVIAAVIVSLTRIFLIINSLSSLVYRVLDYSAMRARLDVLFETKSMLSSSSHCTGKIGTIRINGKSVSSIDEILEILTGAKRGRFTITGENGSGKSTALLTLKRIYGDGCFLLPVHHADLLWRSTIPGQSTGQRILACLDEILNIDDLKYILLDEWDANLDPLNAATIDSALDAIAKTKTVIEIRHLRSQT